MKKIQKKDIPSFIIALIFITAIIFVTVKFTPQITKLVSNPQNFRSFLLSYGNLSVLIFILFQIMQVVIAVIPGEVMQLAGGYVYGTFLGALYSSIGILLGSVITLYTVRLLGYNVIKLFVSEKSLEKFDFLMNNKKSEFAIFILFLIPGLPKDMLTYIAGLTPIKPRKFFILTTIARFPALFVSSYVGSSLQDKQYTEVIIISVIAIILFIIGYFNKDKIINLVKHE